MTPVLRLAHTRLPSPAREDWLSFLHWLVDDRSFTAREIIYVVEKPHRFGDVYDQFVAAGGAGR